MTEFLSTENTNKLIRVLWSVYSENHRYELADEIKQQMIRWYRGQYDAIRMYNLRETNREFLDYFITSRTVSRDPNLSQEVLPDGLYRSAAPRYTAFEEKYDQKMYDHFDKIMQEVDQRKCKKGFRSNRHPNSYGKFTTSEVLNELKLGDNDLMSSLSPHAKDDLNSAVLRNRYQPRRNKSRVGRHQIEESSYLVYHECDDWGVSGDDCRACNNEASAVHKVIKRTPFELTLSNSPFTLGECLDYEPTLSQYEFAARMKEKQQRTAMCQQTLRAEVNELNYPIKRGEKEFARILGSPNLKVPAGDSNRCYNINQVGNTIHDIKCDSAIYPTTSKEYFNRNWKEAMDRNSCNRTVKPSLKSDPGLNRVTCRFKEELRRRKYI